MLTARNADELETAVEQLTSREIEATAIAGDASRPEAGIVHQNA